MNVEKPESDWMIFRTEIETDLGTQVYFQAKHRIYGMESPMFDSYDKAWDWTYQGNRND